MGSWDGFVAIRQQLSLWLSVSRSRRQLAALDDAMLTDIGMTRAAATMEAQRPFWDTTHKVDAPKPGPMTAPAPAAWRHA